MTYNQCCGFLSGRRPDGTLRGVLTILTDGTDLALVSQPEFSGSPGIRRGGRNPITGQLIDYTTDQDVNVLQGALARNGTLKASEHVVNYQRENPNVSVTGYTGKGNLLTNCGHTALICEGSESRRGFYYVDGEDTPWDGR